jgi:hypothetical protein
VGWGLVKTEGSTEAEPRRRSVGAHEVEGGCRGPSLMQACFAAWRVWVVGCSWGLGGVGCSWAGMEPVARAGAGPEGCVPEDGTTLWQSLGGGGFCFHFLIVAYALNKKRCRTDTREEAVVLSGSSKATMRDKHKLAR